MPSVFNIVRVVLYGEFAIQPVCTVNGRLTGRWVTGTAVVLVWTIICLAIAVHFQSLLVSSDLSEYTLLW